MTPTSTHTHTLTQAHLQRDKALREAQAEHEHGLQVLRDAQSGKITKRQLRMAANALRVKQDEINKRFKLVRRTR